MSIIAEIYNFFEQAATDARIGHVIGGRKRFYGFNFEEFETNTKDENDFFPCLGLSDAPHSGLVGSYTSGPEETSVASMIGINVLILDNPEQGNYTQEKDIYDALLPVCDDLILYIHAKVSLGCQSTWPFLDRIDLSSINISRVGPKGTAKAYGWKIFIAFKKRRINTNYNPFNSILG